MSFRRKVIFDVGHFDDRTPFAGEDLDLCLRVTQGIPCGRLAFVPESRVVHHFEPELRDTLRRSRAYGIGSARLYRKWPSLPPTLFPGPVLVLMLIAASPWVPVLAVAAILMPHLLYPRGLRHAVRHRQPAAILDAYVQLAQETCHSVGFVEGLWRFRRLTSMASTPPRQQGAREL